MKIKRVKDKIYFAYEDISFANVSISGDILKLELIKTEIKFRNKKHASKLLKKVIPYLENETECRFIYANPLPLDSNGLSLENLIKFYDNHGFNKSDKANINEPYLMVKKLNTK